MSKKRNSVLIELNAQGEGKTKISPVGLVEGVDGRKFNIEPNRVVSKMQEQKVDIALNVNHGIEEFGEKAAGWFDVNSLEVRDDGIYATLTPTDIGEEIISKKHFRYLSPEYYISWNGDIREVQSIGAVGLVNSPNVLDEALNHTEEDPKTEDPQITHEEDNVTEKEKELQQRLEEAEQNSKRLAQELKKQRIDHAIAAGELMPNRQAFAMGLDGEVLDEFLALEKENNKHLTQTLSPDNQSDESPMSDEEKEINRQLGLIEEGDK